MDTPPPAPDLRPPDLAIFEALEQCQAEIGASAHDTLCQSLSGAALIAKALARRAATAGEEDAAELAQLSEMIDRSLDGTRTLLHRLQPIQPGPMALMTALARLATETAQSVPCEFQCAEPVLLPEAPASRALYRIAEGAVQSALGAVTVARIRISLQAAGGVVEVVVRIDGAGAAAVTESDRWKVMQWRAEAMQGSLRCEGSADGGTTVTCGLPAGLGNQRDALHSPGEWPLLHLQPSPPSPPY